MRVFLTGGTGFVGSHVARALVAAGHEVRGLQRRGGRRGAVAGVEWVAGDLLDPPSLRAAAAGCEAVIHVAADLLRVGSAAARVHQRLVNVDGTRNVVDAALAAGARRLVHTSSVAAIGCPPPGTVGDERTPYDWPPGLPYHESKRDAEQVALAAVARGLPTVVLSPALVLGPGDPGRRFEAFLRLVERGLARVAPPGGVTLCDVRDVAAAHVAALEFGRPGERYVLGGPHVTWAALFKGFADPLGAPPPLFTVPRSAMRLASLPLVALERLLSLKLVAGDPARLSRERYYDSTKAATELGYTTRPAAETLADTVASLRGRG